MNPRKLKFALILFITIVLLSGCASNEPKFTTVIELSNISDNEYNHLGWSIRDSIKQNGMSVQDLKKLTVEVNLDIEPKLPRTIEIPDLLIIDRYDKVRTVSGESTDQNNTMTEDFAASSKEVIFDARGLDENQLREIYKTSMIHIEWQSKGDDIKKKDISIGESMTIR